MDALSIVHTESSIGWGGQELRILTEMEGMQRRGHRVHLVTADRADILQAARDRGLPADGLPIAAKKLHALRAMRRWLAQNGVAFDVINTHSSTDTWLVALARSTLRGLPPVVRTRHVSTPINNAWSTRWVYQRATAHIVVTGEALKTQLVQQNRFDPARITSVRTGIDLARFRPLDRLDARRRLGVDARPALAIVATLRDWKGHDDLLDAWMILRARIPGWQLLVIGDGPRRAHLQGRAAAMGLAEDVRFTGNQDDVASWYACADIAVLPSYGDEGVPQALMQAAACGLPAVSTPIGAIAEAVVDGETGFLVPKRNPVKLAAALARLMNDNALCARMGHAAVARAQANFGIDRMLDGMEAVFAQVASLRKK
ncbi:MAG: glycosyltransferase family 4 protein [Burkholderiales bacterium]|nr:glycosyltransferase family 4 protein [Burkholderiales bacterium]